MARVIDLVDKDIDVSDANRRAREYKAAAKAYCALATCYRIGKRPSEALLTQLEKANEVMTRDE